ncbi:MAG: DUF460 domain-containing protein [Candidatus Nezhaarchaeota archaeon]|nr:DUF460 domain-containing protein [Candidatus Nezhaarchaeota archaeon]MCX8141987.1 DUF460 domain-containing protein [Candidatus Nezhaarchaeota archaeon]MDW8050232.1 DUF460 domain-containing protein [Nitrososphaerota archaeon]
MALNDAVSKHRIVMGLDLVPSQHHMQQYALVIVDEKGTIRDRRECADWKTVLNLINEYDVDTIAVDSLNELGSSISEIKKRLGRYIDKVKLVEVTKCNEGHLKLSELAFKEGILSERRQHLSPLQAAEVSAILALRGIGTVIVDPLSIKTIVVVSKGRSLSAGGMSQQRYSRSQRTAIKQVTDMLLEELKKYISNDDMEHYVQKSKYGLERSIFILNCPPSQVRRWLKPLRELIKKSSVSVKLLAKIPAFEELHALETTNTDKPLIVGLDPGIVTGLAIIDLNGDPIFVGSGLALDKITITRLLTKSGKPIVVASDVRHAPGMVEKVASLLGCVVYTPPRDITVEEKRRIIQDHISNFKHMIKNAHQRDALAAALKAYLSFKSKFTQLEARAKELNLTPSQLEKAKAMIIKGLTMKEALDRVLLKDENEHTSTSTTIMDPEVQKLKQELSKLRDKIEEQSRIIKNLEESRLLLLKNLKEKEAKIEELEDALMKALLKARPSHEGGEDAYKQKLELLTRAINELESKVKNFEGLVDKLRDLIRGLARKEVVLIKEVRSITKKSIEEAIKYGDVRKGDIIFIRDPSSSNLEGLQCLLDIEPKAIIAPQARIPINLLELLNEKCIPVIGPEEVKTERILNFLYTSNLIEDLIRKKQEALTSIKDQLIRKRFMDLLRSYREERARQLKNIYQ